MELKTSLLGPCLSTEPNQRKVSNKFAEAQPVSP
jgi:hypothetical protein